jgi:hypothetical protein
MGSFRSFTTELSASTALKPFNPNPVRLHADLGGKIGGVKKEAARLAGAMRAVETVIPLFDPAYDVHRIAVRRPAA